MSTSVLKALPGKLDIKRHSPSSLYLLHRGLVSLLLGAIVRSKIEAFSYGSHVRLNGGGGI